MNILTPYNSRSISDPNQRQAPTPSHRHNSENSVIERSMRLGRLHVESPVESPVASPVEATHRERRYTPIQPMTNNEINAILQESSISFR